MFEDDDIKETSDVEMMKDNMFVVRFPEEMGIPEWTVRACQRPSVSVVLSDDDANPKIIGYKWNPVKITLVHPIGEFGATKNKKIMDWFMSYMNDVFNGEETSCGLNVYIEMLDRLGCVVEKWLLADCVVISADFGECDYNKDRMSTTTIKVLPRYCTLVDMSS